ncbi:MAG: RNA replicase beta chain [Sanya fiers-like virus 14]|nr:MAG: RNA replicase beta chain [Sanya fiers-like virus 14]
MTNYFCKENNFLVILNESIIDILTDINTPRSLALAIALRYGEVCKELFDCSPFDYTASYNYQLDTQAIALFKKSVYLKYDGDIKAEAVEHFVKVDGEIPKDPEDLPILEDAGFVYECQRMISSILGDLPDLSTLEVSMTSGTNASYNTSKSTVADKLGRSIRVSPTAVNPLIEFLESAPALKRVAMTHGIDIMSNQANGDNCPEFQVVPKQYNKGRGIVKTHFGDMLLQRAYGLYMKKRLLKVGIDIQSAQDTHKFVLKHFHDSFATIDLSDASDRISTVLVKALLPHDWYYQLCKIRNRFVKLPDGSVHELNKFMCQGCGFTFELETLLFYCIAMTAMRRAGQKPCALVFGDDTIVPDASSSVVMQAYTSCGLVVNFNKSFSHSSFKESCGYDTFDGIPVRPLYIKDLGHEKVFAYIKLANIIFRLARNLFGGLNNAVYCNRARNRIIRLFKDKYRYEVPVAAGDIAFISDEVKPTYSSSGNFFRYFKRTYKRSDYKLPVKEEASESAYILAGHSSRGDLVRFSKYDITSARLYGFPSTNRYWVTDVNLEDY